MNGPVAAGVFLLLHVVPILGLRCAWGVDAWRYLPPGAVLALAVAWILLLVPPLRSRAAEALSRGGGAAGRILGVLLLGAVVLGMPSALPLLGDGILHLRDFERLQELGVGFHEVRWANDNAPLSTWLAVALQRLGGGLWESPGTTFRVLGAAGALLYALLAFWTASRSGSTPGGRAIVLTFLLSAGYVQLFCGYVELYALIPAALLAYLACGAAGRPMLGAVALGVLVPLHVATVSLAPSLAVLAARTGKGPPGMRAVRAAGALGVAALVSLALFRALGFDVGAFLSGPRGANVLPLLAEPGPRHNYSLLAMAHFLDVAQQYFLAAPAAVMALPLLRRSSPVGDGTFLGTAALFPFLVTAVANPEVGPFRDWDALSFAAVPLTLWVALRLARAPGTGASGTAMVIGGAAVLHTLGWIGVNALAPAAEERFRTLLESCPVSQHAVSYGWESLGGVQLRADRREDAADAFEKALSASPDNPRLWEAAGRLHVAVGRAARAEECFAECVRLDPARTDAWFALGILIRGRGEEGGAREAFQRFLELEGEGPRAEAVRGWLAE